MSMLKEAAYYKIRAIPGCGQWNKIPPKSQGNQRLQRVYFPPKLSLIKRAQGFASVYKICHVLGTKTNTNTKLTKLENSLFFILKALNHLKDTMPKSFWSELFSALFIYVLTHCVETVK